MSEPLLSISNLSVYYGAVCALQQISFDVLPGQVVTFIGANGSGKSTLLNTILGIVKAYQGKIVYQGKDITQQETAWRVSQGIVLSPEGRGVFSRLSVEDNMILGAFTQPDVQKNRLNKERLYARWPRLYEKRHVLAGSLSGGEQQILALCRAMMAMPMILCLDEPTLGLAPVFIDLVFDWLVELKEAGMTILLVEQNADMALDLAHYGYALEVGCVRASGPAQELLSSPEVLSAYFGE